VGVGVDDAIAFLVVGVGNGSVGFGVGKDSFLLKTSDL
jgi:ribosomal protein S5